MKTPSKSQANSTLLTVRRPDIAALIDEEASNVRVADLTVGSHVPVYFYCAKDTARTGDLSYREDLNHLCRTHTVDQCYCKSCEPRGHRRGMKGRKRGSLIENHPDLAARAVLAEDETIDAVFPSSNAARLWRCDRTPTHPLTQRRAQHMLPLLAKGENGCDTCFPKAGGRGRSRTTATVSVAAPASTRRNKAATTNPWKKTDPAVITVRPLVVVGEKIEHTAERVAAMFMEHLGELGVCGGDRTNDGGIDVHARDAIAQVKHWANGVGPSPVRELAGVMAGHPRFRYATEVARSQVRLYFFALAVDNGIPYTPTAREFALSTYFPYSLFAYNTDGIDWWCWPVNATGKHIVRERYTVPQVAIGDRTAPMAPDTAAAFEPTDRAQPTDYV